VGSKMTAYLLIGFSERAENWDLTISFHGLSNGMTYFKIKILTYAGLVDALMDPLLKGFVDMNNRFLSF